MLLKVPSVDRFAKAAQSALISTGAKMKLVFSSLEKSGETMRSWSMIIQMCADTFQIEIYESFLL